MTSSGSCAECVPGSTAGCAAPAPHVLYFAAPRLVVSAYQNGADQLHARLQSLEPKQGLGFAGYNVTFETEFRMTRAEQASAVSSLLDAAELDRMVAQDHTNLRHVYVRFGHPVLTFTLRGPKNLAELALQKDAIRLQFGLDPQGRRRHLLADSLADAGARQLRVEAGSVLPSESWLRLHLEIYPETEIQVVVPGVMGKTGTFFSWATEDLSLQNRMRAYLQLPAGVTGLSSAFGQGLLAVRARSDEKLPREWAQVMDSSDDLQEFFKGELFDGQALHAVDSLRVTQRLAGEAVVTAPPPDADSDARSDAAAAAAAAASAQVIGAQSSRPGAAFASAGEQRDAGRWWHGKGRGD